PALPSIKKTPDMKTHHPFLLTALSLSLIIYSCASDEAKRKSYDENAPDKSYSNSAAMDSTVSTNRYAPQQTQEYSGSSGVTGGNQNESTDKSMAADEENFAFRKIFASSAASLSKLDSTHSFVRTADLKFRVKNTAAATYRIEDIVRHFGGWVANTQLESSVYDERTTRISEDSSLVTTRFVVNNSMTLRIPATNLDTFLKAMVPFVDFFDHRTINVNDITLDLLANRLEQERNAKFSKRFSADIDTKPAKLASVQDAEESLLNNQAASDNALIQNLRMADQVNYSTVTMSIYQKESIRQELVANEKSYESYEPGLGTKLGHAFVSGWRGLKIILIILVTLWPFWVFGGLTWYLVRWGLKKRKASETKS
ncbi:MAG TPA: DUF4349 domain-containing protein, partial [Bacteroidia bacterium]|nr:DUF4349 domain-containing protein [Bacteroidia bacterium]